MDPTKPIYLGSAGDGDADEFTITRSSRRYSLLSPLIAMVLERFPWDKLQYHLQSSARAKAAAIDDSSESSLVSRRCDEE
ncbi:uncharacterized protein A4U43_C07F1200 [Asparagus officinalis]|uniref:Uncharacterized protein n=1 Tax=Asparagus officinalis TaxID=4686 RepID=A0A5P1EBL1_ASPOF|nr:uncharacterized protein A4U43_C07F1200 [Asparagus officinalis]